MNSKLLAAVAVFGAACLPMSASAQPANQLLKEVWTGTQTTVLEVDGGTALGFGPAYGVGADLKALAVAYPVLSAGSDRPIVAADGAKLIAVVPGKSAELLHDASDVLSSIQTVATTPAGTVLFSGAAKRGKDFELWEYDMSSGARTRRSSGFPQLNDAVYVPSTDVIPVLGRPELDGGGLLAVTDGLVVFFATNGQPPYYAMTTLFDARSLPSAKGNLKLLGIDLVRKSGTMLVARSDRLVFPVTFTGTIGNSIPVPNIAGRNCTNIKDQRLIVRNAAGSTEPTSVVNSVSFVSDVCGQVVRLGFSATGVLAVGSGVYATTGLKLLAVAEGQTVVCKPSEPPCLLTSGFEAILETTVDVELLVLKFDLCDPRVQQANCTRMEGVNVLGKDTLLLNGVLPPAIASQLAALDADPETPEFEPLQITIPPYMFAAGPGGKFGAVLVQTDDPGAAARVAGRLTAIPLGLGFHLGVREDFPVGTPVLSLLNQDLAAYVPDDPRYPTVRGFAHPSNASAPGFVATPVTVGTGSGRVGLRGFSLVPYGLMFDLNPNDAVPTDGLVPARATTGGLPAATQLDYGTPPMCNLTATTEPFVAQSVSDHYFFNLAACLFSDLRALTNSEMVAGAVVATSSIATLNQRLDVAEDKLAKALNSVVSGGASAGTENFNSTVTQLGNFDEAIRITAFKPEVGIYKNELLVRSQALQFNLRYRSAAAVR